MEEGYGKWVERAERLETTGDRLDESVYTCRVEQLNKRLYCLSRESDLEKATPLQHIHFVPSPVMRAVPKSTLSSLSSLSITPLLLSPPRSSFPSPSSQLSRRLHLDPIARRYEPLVPQFSLPSPGRRRRVSSSTRKRFNAQRDRWYVGVERALGGRLQ